MIKDKVDINFVTVIVAWYLFCYVYFTMLELKPSFFIQTEKGKWCDISLCMLLLPLINKELLWAYDREEQN